MLDSDDLSKSIALTEIKLLESLPVGSDSSTLWCKDSDEVCKLSGGKPTVVTHPLIVPVSARTGAGVDMLWKELISCADSSSVRYDDNKTPSSNNNHGSMATGIFGSTRLKGMPGSSKNNSILTDTRVREHLNAHKLRKMAHPNHNNTFVS